MKINLVLKRDLSKDFKRAWRCSLRHKSIKKGFRTWCTEEDYFYGKYIIPEDNLYGVNFLSNDFDVTGIDNGSISGVLLRIRDDHKISQKQLGDVIGMDQRRISEIERFQRYMPISTFIILAQTYFQCQF